MAMHVVNVRGTVSKGVFNRTPIEDFIDAPDIESLVKETKLTRDEMKKILDDNEIEYKSNIKTDALEKLVKEFI